MPRSRMTRTPTMTRMVATPTRSRMRRSRTMTGGVTVSTRHPMTRVLGYTVTVARMATMPNCRRMTRTFGLTMTRVVNAVRRGRMPAETLVARHHRLPRIRGYVADIARVVAMLRRSGVIRCGGGPSSRRTGVTLARMVGLRCMPELDRMAGRLRVACGIGVPRSALSARGFGFGRMARCREV
ncbi:hypothetical protein [Nocardia sp. NPDC049149]|uniref:hypothetical protein n=1 Tax=Nocardia sp. NPDC049149 TaxID=3364315 RepID=UPI003711DE6D